MNSDWGKLPVIFYMFQRLNIIPRDMSFEGWTTQSYYTTDLEGYKPFNTVFKRNYGDYYYGNL